MVVSELGVIIFKRLGFTENIAKITRKTQSNSLLFNRFDLI